MSDVPPASRSLPRILLVEAHDDMRRMQVRFLSRTFAVDFATTGEEALEMALGRSYAAIVIDVYLQGRFSGVEVMQGLKATPQHRSTAMIATSGPLPVAERDRLIRLGFDFYLAKPFRWDVLLDVVRHAVAQSTGQPSPSIVAPRHAPAAAALSTAMDTPAPLPTAPSPYAPPAPVAPPAASSQDGMPGTGGPAAVPGAGAPPSAAVSTPSSPVASPYAPPAPVSSPAAAAPRASEAEPVGMDPSLARLVEQLRHEVPISSPYAPPAAPAPAPVPSVPAGAERLPPREERHKPEAELFREVLSASGVRPRPPSPAPGPEGWISLGDL